MAEQQNDFDQEPMVEVWVDTDGGVDGHNEAFYLKPNQCAYLKNAELDALGRRKRRTGMFSYSSPGGEPQGLDVYRIERAQYMYGIWDKWLYRSAGLGTYGWTPYPSNTAATQISLVDASYKIVQGRVTHGGGVDNAAFICGVHPYTNTTYPALAYVPDNWGYATMNVSFAPRDMVWYQGRLWLLDQVYKLRWSNILDGGTIDTSNYIDVNPNDGDEGMALAPTRGDNARLYIFKRGSIYALDIVWDGGAYIPTTENALDTTSSRLSIVSSEVGCVAPKTIVYSSGSQRSDIFFLAGDGYRSLLRVEQDVAGGAGEPISVPVQDVIDRIYWAKAHLAHAAVWDRKIFLSLPVDFSDTCNITLVYDLEKKAWVGEYDWQLIDSAVYAEIGSADKLVSQWAEHVSHTYYTQATATTHVFQLLYPDIHYDPAGAAIEYQELTREFVHQDMGRVKRWDWAELRFLEAYTNMTVTVEARVDRGAWSTISSGQITGDATTGYCVETYNLTDLEPGQRIQLRVTCDDINPFAIQSTRVAAWLYPYTWE